jgi:MFS family permease
MIDVMDKHFQSELHLTLAQSAWVQFAHYLGYFLMALPAGWLATKLGYKGGIITGLLMVAAGGFWFIPATHIASFWAFLVGVCVIASGLTFLETIANPYTTVLGTERYAATRINLAQSCNGIGWILGPIAGAAFFYGKDASGNSTGSETLWIPYAAVGVVVVLLAVVFFFAPVPDIKMEDDYRLDDDSSTASHSIWAHPHFVLAVAAQFLYVAAQAGIFSFFINYMTSQTPPIPDGLRSGVFANWFEPGMTGAVRLTDSGAARLASLGFVFFRALHRRGHPEGVLRPSRARPLRRAQRAGMLRRGLEARLGVCGERVPELLLHVDHVPDHLRPRHPRPRRPREEGVRLHRHGDHGRGAAAEGDGGRGRPLRHVARVRRAAGLLRLRRVLRVRVAAAERQRVARRGPHKALKGSGTITYGPSRR